MRPNNNAVDPARGMGSYLDLMIKTLTASVYTENEWNEILPENISGPGLRAMLNTNGYALVDKAPDKREARANGEDWPLFGLTMIGPRRLANIYGTLATCIEENVAGDFVECWVWRGGASIFARAVLKHFGCRDRTVWLADSFAGMPEPAESDAEIPDLADNPFLAVSLERVRDAFDRFGLLDDQVRFVEGWFSESLPGAPIDSIAVLRLDCDYYSSTTDALNALYPRVSPGGFVVVDDYNTFDACKRAVEDFRKTAKIDAPIVKIDGHGVYWRVPTMA